MSDQKEWMMSSNKYLRIIDEDGTIVADLDGSYTLTDEEKRYNFRLFLKSREMLEITKLYLASLKFKLSCYITSNCIADTSIDTLKKEIEEVEATINLVENGD